MNVFELPPAGPNPPYGPGNYQGCCVAVCADFIFAYAGQTITNLSALGKSMGQRHRSVDRKCLHGISPHAWCAYCIYLELNARGIPVAYQQLDWPQIRTLVNNGQYVALAGMYGRIPVVNVSSYSPTIPAEGRSDTYTGPHMICLTGTENAGLKTKALDPDFGNYRGTPPYSLLGTGDVQAYWQALSYAVTYATKPPPAPNPPTPTAPEEPMDPTVIPDLVVDCKGGGALYKLVSGKLTLITASWGGAANVGTYGVQPHAEPPRKPPAAPLRALRLTGLGGANPYVGYYGNDLCSTPRAR